MITKLVFDRLRTIIPQRSQGKLNYWGLSGFLRLNARLERSGPNRLMSAVVMDRNNNSRLVEANIVSAHELQEGFREWQTAAPAFEKPLFNTPLDDAEEKEEGGGISVIDKLGKVASKVLVVQSYPDGRFEGYGYFDSPTYLFIMENAPWNQGGNRELQGVASIIWEVLFDNFVLGADKNFAKSTQRLGVFSTTLTDASVKRMSMIFLKGWSDKRHPTGEEIALGMLHLKLVRYLAHEVSPSLEKVSASLAIPEEILLPFLQHIMGKYQNYFENRPFIA